MLKSLEKDLNFNLIRPSKRTLTRRIVESCFPKTVKVIEEDIEEGIRQKFTLSKKSDTLVIKRCSRLSLPVGELE